MAGSLTSGSALLSTEIGSDAELDQCIAISPSTDYDFEGFGFVPLASSVDTALRIKMTWFEQANCVTQIFNEVLASVQEIQTWTPMARTRPSPPNAASGRFTVEFLKSPPFVGVVSAFVDALFVPEPTQGAASLTTLTALGALAGVSRRAPRASNPARPR